MTLDFHKVASSNITEIAHDGEDLYVRFNGGALWKYSKVPTSQYETMRNQHSIGSYFFREIKSQYAGVRVE